MAKYPVFPMWVADYLADTAHLNAQEHGIYHLLLYRYWLTECRPLPEDRTFLRRVAKARKWADVEQILTHFWIHEAGIGWHHKRARSEFAVAADRKVAQQQNAKKRWKINDDTHPTASRRQCSSSSSSSSSSFSSLSPSQDSRSGGSDKRQEEKKSKPKEKSARFQRPTAQQVAQYCAERGNKVDPQRWMDHYEANGWKVGKNAMKNWKAAVRTWEGNGIGDKSNSKSATRDELLDAIRGPGPHEVGLVIDGEFTDES